MQLLATLPVLFPGAQDRASHPALLPWPGPTSSPSTQGPFVLADATKITLAPSSADINSGDNLTLQCHASHDPTMDLTFIWTLDDFPIDFDKPGGHYRRASVVRPETREPRAPPSFWADRGPTRAINTPKAFPPSPGNAMTASSSLGS